MGSVSLHENDRLEELVEGQELKNRPLHLATTKIPP